MSRSKAARLVDEARELMDTADSEGRPLADYERERVEQCHAKAAQLIAASKGIAPRVPAGAGLEVFRSGHNVPAGDGMNMFGQSLGDAFVKTEQYQRIKSAIAGGSRFSESVELPLLQAKGTMMEGAGGGGGALAVTVPQVAPGVVDVLFRPLTLETLLSAEQATTATVRYVQEGTATSGAAGVAEGGSKPESTIGLVTVDEAVKKTATVLVVSDEMLEDAPAVQQFVSGQLSLFVNLEVERQLLRGTSGGNEIQGLLTSRGVPIYAGGTAAGNMAVQIFKAMNGMRGSAFVEPDWVALSPADYQTIRLLTDNAGQLLGGGPSLGQYGNGSQAAGAQMGGPLDTLWGKTTYVSPLLGAGTAVIGSRAGAAVWSRGGLRVEMSNSDGSQFRQNLVSIRAERRAALAVYRPTAFVEVRLA